MALFETRGLGRCFRSNTKFEIRAVNGLSLTIAKGAFALVTGPSGSGKSTLLCLLAGLDRPTEGQLIFDGRDIGSFSDVELARYRRRTGFIFQNFSLIPDLTVLENVVYPLIPRGIRRRERNERAREALARLGLCAKESVFPSELSGGEQQRVAVARALGGHPEILIADEPTSNLDSTSNVKAILQELHVEGRTVIVASHSAEFAPLATTVYRLEAGKLVTDVPAG
jgi:putative ABC transport system ATP-binding protein